MTDETLLQTSAEPTTGKGTPEPTEASREPDRAGVARVTMLKSARAELEHEHGGPLSIAQEIDTIAPPEIVPLLNAVMKRYLT